MLAKKTQNMHRDTKTISSRPNFSRFSLLFFIVIFAAIGSYVLWRGLAAPSPPTVYLTPASQVYGTSTSFSVQIRENSGSTAVNAVQANLSYPTNLLTLVSIDSTGSAFATQAQSTGSSGTITVARGTCGGCAALTGDQLVTTLNFTTKTTGGAAAVAFTSGTVLVSASSNQDILGSLSATGSGSYTIDTTPPTVSITSPANNATLAGGSTVSVTVSASDASSSVSKVEVYVDGSLASTINSSPYTYSWNTTSVSLGSHTLQAKAYDTFSNMATSSLITVNLTDQTAPSTPSSFRTTGNSLTSINLAWNASTDNVGVVSYKIKRGGTLISTVNSPTLAYNDTGLTAGTAYSYTIQAVDAASNTSTATSLNASTQTIKQGDLNGDGSVNVTDLSILLSDWGTTNAAADINNDGTVNIFDLSILLSNYGS